VISPLLANLYTNRFLKHWRMRGCGATFRAHLVNYADDFVILSRGHAAEALAWTRTTMTGLGLTFNEAKTSLKDAKTEGFDFLGYTLGPKFATEGGKKYLGAGPSKKSVQRVKDKIGELLRGGRERPVAASARQTEPPAGGLVGLIQLRNPPLRLPGRRSPCHRTRPQLPRQTAQGGTPFAPISPTRASSDRPSVVVAFPVIEATEAPAGIGSGVNHADSLSSHRAPATFSNLGRHRRFARRERQDAPRLRLA
jgi:hypothetical protein